MNKKGFIQAVLTTGMLAVLGIIVLMVLIFGWKIIETIFSNILVLLGSAVIIVGLIYSFKSKKPLNTIVITSIIGILLIIFNYSGFVEQSIYGNEDVYVLDFGHIECKESDVITKAPQNQYLDTFTRLKESGVFGRYYYLIKCNEYVNECKVVFNSDRDSVGFFGEFPNGRYSVCNLDGTSCSSETEYLSNKIANKIQVPIDYGQSVKIIPDSNTAEITLVTKEYRQFEIWGQERGQKFLQTTGCTLSDELESKVKVNEPNRLEKGQVINYVIGSDLVSTKTYTYQGQKVICSATQLYKVDTESFKDGSSIKVQGDRLKAVECCPTQPNCDADTFTFEEDVERECTTNSQCINGGNPIPIDDTHYYVFTCANEQCVQSNPIEAECTTTSECQRKHGGNSICDLSLINYGTCKDAPTDNNFCGNGVCDSLSGETSNSCSADCTAPTSKQECLDKADKYPYLGYEYIETQSEKGKGIFGIGSLFGWTETVTTSYCRATFVPYFLIGGVILIGGSILILTNRKRRR